MRLTSFSILRFVTLLSVAYCLLLACQSAFALGDEDWQKKLKAKAAELTQKNGTGTDATLKAELLKMRETDRDIRVREIQAQGEQQKALGEQEQQTDKQLTARLEEIVASKGWPTIRLVGIEASAAAGLILIHSPDHEFQRKMLPELYKLVDTDQIAGTEVALITDKLLVADGKPQRFGTQFNELNGKLVMFPVEDPEHLEQRRDKYLLPPLAYYKKQLADTYNMPVE